MRLGHVRFGSLALAIMLFADSMWASSMLAQSNKALDGNFVLQRMHDTYAGQWYRTLTFTQKTTRHRPDGAEVVTTWLESLRHTDAKGSELRIDMGELKDGRGVLYTADSSWQMRDGKVTNVSASGNEFLPLIESVYLQPVARTAQELTREGFDLSRAYQGRLDGQPVWVVGASSAADSMTQQFAVDTVRKVLLRMTLARPGGQPPIDVRLDGYVRAGKGWLATHVAMTVGGKPFQMEDYTDWKIDVQLPASLFDPQQWNSAPHWAKPKTPSN